MPGARTSAPAPREGAATDPRPQLRDPVGKDAQVVFSRKRLLPERRFERAMEWIFRNTVVRKHGPRRVE